MIINLFNCGARHILLEGIDVLSDAVGVLLDIAVSFKPEIVRLSENNQVLRGVANLVLRGVLGLVLDLACKRE